MAEPPGQPLTRRRFLGRSVSVGAGLAIGGSALLTGCSTSSLTAPPVVPLFSPVRVLVAGRPQRIPIGVVSPSDYPGNGAADGNGQANVAIPNDDDVLEIDITLDGETIDRVSVAGRVVNHDHVGEADPDHQHANIFRYYPLRATLPTPGVYDLIITIPDGRSGKTVQAELPIQIFDPESADVVLPGDPFPKVVTPTFDTPGDIDRLCTRVQACPFHALDATQPVAAGRPMALLVATPAFCSTAYCGPVLETLIEQSGAFPEVDFIHVEVYANTDEVDQNYQDDRIRLAPSVVALGLGFEPSLFLVDHNGIVADRIDNVFDETELTEALTAIRG